MIYTPKQAGEIWCPEVRILATKSAHSGAGSYNRFVEPGASSARPAGVCLGPECAHWRWFINEGGNPEFARDPHLDSFRAAEPTIPTHGYCGKSGRP